MSDSSVTRPGALSRRWAGMILALILVASCLLKLHHLDHLALKGLDESFHAIVAKNLLKHPLVPTLIDRPYLPPRDWQSEHVWLHKPILPLWQIALSYLIFGVNTLALRLPSAILSTAAVWITYAIGCDLLDRTAGLVAAALQAFCPAIVMLVQGYVFSDHVDVALLFWTEIGMWMVVRAAICFDVREYRARERWAYLMFAGVAQGLAFLSKSYPALIVSGVALAAWLLPRAGLAKRGSPRFSLAQLATVAGLGALVVAPWMFWCANQFPDQFVAENSMTLAHLRSNVENFAAPWDRLWLDFLIAAHHVFYTPLLLAGAAMIVFAWREKDGRLWILIAWFFGVMIPFTLARSKTPSATLLGWPGAFVSRAVRGDRVCQSMGMGTVVVAALYFSIFWRQTHSIGIRATPEPARAWPEHLWVVWQLVGALALGGGLWIVLRRARSRAPLLILSSISFCCALGMFAMMIVTAWKVTQLNINEPSLVALGDYVNRNLPGNAVLLFDEKAKLERNTAMFRADRTCYELGNVPWQVMGAQVIANGGTPYVVSWRQLPLKPIYTDSLERRTIYQWSGAPTTQANAARFDEPRP
jgi:4-amino-4-deoxy-L-arabinose transferase